MACTNVQLRTAACVAGRYDATIPKTLMPLSPHLAPAPLLLEVSLVAHRLSVSPEFVRVLLRRKALPAVRFGRRWRVDAADLQAYIDGHRVPSGTMPPHPARLRDETQNTA